ncbi:hypothetical protein [Clostridium sp. YIM B02551]|uniref:hypothetical protein n=1 Tax=Clostridium sp. YIM B02551 TaxID=2910679 RepID=UPI001EEBDBCF|nr:hypothetical protein [Clostridium sp. YIM B02551]
MEELRPITISFKKKNPEEVELSKILSRKSSAAAFVKDILIDLLVRGKNQQNEIKLIDTKRNETVKDEISEIFDL